MVAVPAVPQVAHPAVVVRRAAVVLHRQVVHRPQVLRLLRVLRLARDAVAPAARLLARPR